MAAAEVTTIIDGRLVDAVTVLCGIIVAGTKWFLRYKRSKRTTVGKLIMDLLTGSVLVPFAMMVMGVFSVAIYSYTIHASLGSTALAGAIGLIFVAAELRKL